VQQHYLTIQMSASLRKEASPHAPEVRTYRVKGLPGHELAFVQWSATGWFIQRLSGQKMKQMPGYFNSAQAALEELEYRINQKQ
jgi:hypothetical protein